MRLFEVQIAEVVRPNNNQKRILAKIAASPTSSVAANEISTGQNIVVARDTLMKMGLITMNNNSAEMTERGRQVAQEENILDAEGNLTQAGKQWAYTDAEGEFDTQDQQLDKVPVPPLDPAQTAPARQPELTYGESFSLLKELLN